MLFPHVRTCRPICLTITALSIASGCAMAADTAKTEGPKLYVMDCGQVLARDISLFNPLIAQNTVMALVSPCYLIQQTQGTLLWETDINDELFNTQGAEVFGGAFHMSVQTTLLSQLQSINIKPDDISYLSFSHLHNDHTGNAKPFKNATWLMQNASMMLPIARMQSTTAATPMTMCNYRR